MSDYRPSALLKVVSRHVNVCGDIPMPYNLWEKIFMIEEEYITYERTCKEKYRLLQRHGIISKTGMLLYDKFIEYGGDE